MHKILIITDSADKNWKKIFHKQEIDDKFYLHSINTSTESVLQDLQNHPQYKNYQLSEIDISKIHQLAEDEARNYYLKLIKDLPHKKIFNGRSISELLTVNGRNYWWYLPISEKNIWLDKSIHRFFEIKRLHHILNNDKYNKMICCLDDGILQASFQQMAIQKKIPFTNNITTHSNTQGRFAALMFCFAYFINATRAIISLCFKKIFVLNSKTNKNSDIRNSTIGFYSFFPYFWQDIDTDYSEDIYFKKIPDELENNNQVLHLIWLLPWNKLVSNPNWLRRFQKNKNVYILENALKIKDTLSLLYLDIFKHLLFILLRKRKIQLGTIEGVKIDDIVYDEFFRSFSSPTFFQAMLIDKALQKIPLNKCKLLFFRLEFQPHERAILNNTKGRVKSIGFQHSALSKNFLNYVFMKDELGTHWEKGTESISMPLPDHIFTSGQVGFDYMSNAGYPSKNIDIVGGIRFSDIYNYNQNKPNKIQLRKKYGVPINKNIIFLPTSLLLDETINMLDAFLYAIKNKLTKYFLIIKCHPASNSKEFISRLNKYLSSRLDNNSYNIITYIINTYDYIFFSDLSIFLGGSMVIEAMALSAQSIVFLPRNNFSHNPITEYLDTVQYAYDRNSMKNVINSLNNQRKANKQKKVVNEMFYDLNVNPNQRFINIFEQLNKEVV